MKVVFRVDASIWIGSGHVMRCLVLADALSKKGHQVEFACSPLKGDMRTFIRECGFNVITLAEPLRIIEPQHDADYEAWLQKSTTQDAQDFLAAVKAADLVVTDHYAIGAEWQEQIVVALDCCLLAIDDLGRCHRADLVLDQTLGRSEADYASSNTEALVGSEYALLRTDFSNKREAALSRQLSDESLRVLVSMGGIDAPNATLKVLENLCCRVNADFTVLLSPRAPHFQQVNAWCLTQPNVQHQDFVSDMANLMLEHDIAIGAPGTTSWERACLGLPSIIVPLAGNQLFICEQLVKHDAAVHVDINDIPSMLHGAFLKVLKEWSQFKEANLAICDGRGVRRVIFEIEQLVSKKRDGVFLQYASEDDIALIYEWQRHPDTRKYALTSNVPKWSEHQTWMLKKLQSTCDYFYMVINRADRSKVGVVRLDRMEADHYLVSIFVDPNSYGKGIAFQALNVIDAIHSDVTLHATVLKENIASQRLFKKARYQQVDEQTYIRQPID
ncbi:UDP-2,4-diacetamido-2,4,6-trideoxy-beta-L-altropyranose hydrolase [Vibrio cholerae]|uniref:UDP-2,4-diacetamido-2,4, 6-trideoxy-beta-L-altropyranose hydrolase n=1 Tax=Vibrio cholerae TaxID=666 RepID=UPI0011D6B06E|nr:UDP-2,4-diacetamido-2,4,6-trideoxy-beta-L-altropyranose hydrolase [Vibrio cholerae]EGR3921541.1 UDP-2,4-diacetamido-2,4,6-trideoxy-beta-L-altropyranose hydrolase [Vibrio cholerae]TXY18656.1 UDP-2,4-diacetamido-2,4,6-trideoxy-beta-L-altropyranose hydrolase [Vibrio cholerae]HDG1516996.1 UDP-2,4-diacetamido-2,4,6-trideoxy-beta-L-altropyranose hydrolase [Vibrio cholerae]